jgi:hypothetical protein
MSEVREEVGRITISFSHRGSAEVTIMGEIPKRQYNSLPIHMRKAINKHKAEVRRGSKKVDMSDKGKKLEDYTSEEEFNDVQPQADPAAAEGIKPSVAPVTLNQILPKVGEEVANDDNDEPISEGEQDGNDSGSEEVCGDDEGPGSTTGSWRK